jgi:hypothetical protein
VEDNGIGFDEQFLDRIPVFPGFYFLQARLRHGIMEKQALGEAKRAFLP